MGIEHIYTCDTCSSLINVEAGEKYATIEAKMEMDDNRNPGNDKRNRIFALVCEDCTPIVWDAIVKAMEG